MISGPFRAAYSGMLKAERGVQIVDTSWRSCVLQTDSVFGFATGYLFAKENEKDFAATKSEVSCKAKERFTTLCQLKYIYYATTIEC